MRWPRPASCWKTGRAARPGAAPDAPACRSMTSRSLVRVGAAGWLYPSWRSGFYPEGLPDDWLLSYYNTQFQAVYLPASVWQAVSAKTWGQWLGDTQEGFCFVLEPAAKAAAQPA